MFLAQALVSEIGYGFIPIVKVEKDAADPSVRYVWGKATDGTVDSDEQIVDPTFAKTALADWYDTAANVRQMHSVNLPPAGRGVMLEHREGDGEYVRTKVVEPVAVKLVDEGVYTGYSVGISRPRIVRDTRARGGRIVGGKIVEISLVDRPANPMAKFMALKADGRGHLGFVGKAVVLDADEDEVEPARPTTKFSRGDHVTVEMDNGELVQGRVLRRGREALAIDTAGYATDGVVTVATSDVVAVYRGSIEKAAGITHTHPHQHGDQPPHEHPHTHAPNHGDHSLTHQHGHTEDSVDDDQTPSEGAPDADAAKAAGTDCMKCKGSGMFGEEKCDKCGGTGKAEIVKDAAAGPDAEPDADDTANKGFPPGKQAPPFGKKPKKPAAAAPAADADGDSDGDANGDSDADDDGNKAAKLAAKAERRVARAAEKAARRSARKAEKAARASLPPVPKGDEAVPWLVRRAHDYACGAYTPEAVAEAYPTVEKGGAGVALGEGARAAAYALLAGEVREGGSPAGIALLGKAIAAFDEIASAEGIPEARAELHDAFKAANSPLGQDGRPEGLPSPSDTITPGSYRRPYLSAGHQQERATEHDASIPTATHPISAEDYTRGPLTEGHQRYLTSKLAELHDALADWKPEICCMDSSGSNAHDRQPAGSFARPPAADRIPNGAEGSGPRRIDLPKTTLAPGEKAASGGSLTAIEVPSPGPTVKGITPEDLAAAVRDAVAPYISKVSDLQTAYDALASAPDTSQAAHRGVMTAGARAKIATPDAAKAERKARRADKRERRIGYYRDLAASSDPVTRINAERRLARLGLDA